MEVARTDQQQTLLQEEARRRVSRALDLIERAQGDLNEACSVLSSLQYAAPQWRSTSAMADKVKAHWYRVESALRRRPAARKVRLDPMAAEGVLARARQAQRPAPASEARP